MTAVRGGVTGTSRAASRGWRGGAGGDAGGAGLGGEGGREREAAEFAFNELGHVTEGAEVPEFLVGDRHGKNVFGEDDDFREGEGIEAEIFDEAEVGTGGREFGAPLAFDKALDDAGDDRGEEGEVAGGAESADGFEGGGRTAFQGFPQVGVVARGGRSGGGAGEIGRGDGERGVHGVGGWWAR